jgi:hypothetical protein
MAEVVLDAAIWPTSAEELDEIVAVAETTTEMVFVIVPATLMQNVDAHLSQEDSESEQASSTLQTGHEPTKAAGHWTQRRKTRFGVNGAYTTNWSLVH